MLKLVIGAIVISAVIGASFVAVPRIVSAVTQNHDRAYSVNPNDFIDDYRGTIASVMHDAAGEIQDTSIANFYGKLVQEYCLEQTYPVETDADISLEQALPDINRIHKAAINLPLQEAGKTIQDEDLACFYQNFIKSAGWEIEPD